ncbi:CaiB/BaiF CoA-transferase family protein [Roseomonas sp. AR75]|uniref:CaiB/BaiF CoA transferase family protein n=1 Tax=Roseomonas sp. AR75 TaxID=2562311 RepID=UPI0010C09C7A|nr:CaiB/BaiF CoA-transferase family protein [Roseomonas sp. AR75]
MGPLDGVKVIEMVGVGPGPFAAMWLADMGAEVIRIGRPGARWNQTRGDVLNRGRRSLAVDLKRPGAAALVLRLVAQADALIEGFRPGVMERLSLGPEACQARNPRLVYGRVTGWGQDGPLAQRAGHDLTYLATTGILASIGAAERPVPPLNLLGDFGGGGMLLVAGILAALVERQRSGRGQVVDAAMTEGASLLAAMIWAYHGKGLWREAREQNLFDGGAPFYGTYRCADGKWLAVGAIEKEFWHLFLDRCSIADAELREAAHDRARWPEMRVRLAAILATRPRADWLAAAEDSDACIAPVLGFTEAPAAPQAAARGAFVEVAGVTQPAPAPRFSRTPGRVNSPPPTPGEHSRAILADWGFAAQEVEALEADGVVVQGDPAAQPSGRGPAA